LAFQYIVGLFNLINVRMPGFGVPRLGHADSGQKFVAPGYKLIRLRRSTLKFKADAQLGRRHRAPGAMPFSSPGQQSF